MAGIASALDGLERRLTLRKRLQASRAPEDECRLCVWNKRGFQGCETSADCVRMMEAIASQPTRLPRGIPHTPAPATASLLPPNKPSAPSPVLTHSRVARPNMQGAPEWAGGAYAVPHPQGADVLGDERNAAAGRGARAGRAQPAPGSNTLLEGTVEGNASRDGMHPRHASEACIRGSREAARRQGQGYVTPSAGSGLRDPVGSVNTSHFVSS